MFVEDFWEVLLAWVAGLSDNTGFDIYGPGGAAALCVLTGENEDRRRVADNAGSRPCAEVSCEVFDHFNPRADGGPPATR